MITPAPPSAGATAPLPREQLDLLVELASAVRGRVGDARDGPDPEAGGHREAALLFDDSGDATLDATLGGDSGPSALGCLREIVEHLRAADADAEMRERASALVRAMSPETLRDLMRSDDDAMRRARLLDDAVHALEPDAVVEVVRAAGDVAGRSLSPAMSAILARLAARARGERASDARADLRAQAMRVLREWGVADTTSGDFATLVSFSTRDDAAACDPAHLLRIALEVDRAGPAALAAARSLASAGEIASAILLLEQGPDVAARRALLDEVVTPERLRECLAAPVRDAHILTRLVDLLGPAAAGSLLAAAAVADEDELSAIADLLHRIGPAAASPICERLHAFQPGTQRRLLALITRLGGCPDGFSLAPYAAHADAAVRREAVRLMLGQPGARDRAIVIGLADADERVLALALSAAGKSCPPAAAGTITRRAEDPALPAEVRGRLVRLLASAGSVDGMRWIVERAVRPHWLLRTPRLDERWPLLSHAVAGLAAHWASHPEAARVLALAARSADPSLRGAVEVRGAA